MAMLPPYQPPTPPAPQGYFPPPPPPAPRKSNHAPLVITGLVVGFLLLAFVGVLGSTNTPARSASASASTSTTTTTAPPTTVSAKAEMAAWGARATPLLSALSDDMTDAKSAAGDYDLSGLSSACRSMVSNATELRTLLPAPDADMSEELDAALSDFQRAGKACQRFAITFDVESGQITTDGMQSGTIHLQNAKAYLDRY
jgi:hypothetical protein